MMGAGGDKEASIAKLDAATKGVESLDEELYEVGIGIGSQTKKLNKQKKDMQDAAGSSVVLLQEMEGQVAKAEEESKARVRRAEDDAARTVAVKEEELAELARKEQTLNLRVEEMEREDREFVHRLNESIDRLREALAKKKNAGSIPFAVDWLENAVDNEERNKILKGNNIRTGEEITFEVNQNKLSVVDYPSITDETIKTMILHAVNVFKGAAQDEEVFYEPDVDPAQQAATAAHQLAVVATKRVNNLEERKESAYIEAEKAKAALADATADADVAANKVDAATAVGQSTDALVVVKDEKERKEKEAALAAAKAAEEAERASLELAAALKREEEAKRQEEEAMALAIRAEGDVVPVTPYTRLTEYSRDQLTDNQLLRKAEATKYKISQSGKGQTIPNIIAQLLGEAQPVFNK